MQCRIAVLQRKRLLHSRSRLLAILSAGVVFAAADSTVPQPLGPPGTWERMGKQEIRPHSWHKVLSFHWLRCGCTQGRCVSHCMCWLLDGLVDRKGYPEWPLGLEDVQQPTLWVLNIFPDLQPHTVANPGIVYHLAERAGGGCSPHPVTRMLW